MPAVIKRLRRKRERVAQETLERLDAEATKGKEAQRRFREATRALLKAGKRQE